VRYVSLIAYLLFLVGCAVRVDNPDEGDADSEPSIIVTPDEGIPDAASEVLNAPDAGATPCAVDSDCTVIELCTSAYCVSGTCVVLTAPAGTVCPGGLCAYGTCAPILVSCAGAATNALCDLVGGLAGICTKDTCCPSCSGRPDGYPCVFITGEVPGSCSEGLCCRDSLCQQNLCF
jgi:hypothetical protein